MWLDCIAVTPSFARKMAAEARALGIRFLGAPVTESKGQAAQAKLVFWVGGEAADLEACRPLLQCMGNRIVYCGGQGMGALLKMVLKPLLWTKIGAVAEGLGFCESIGLFPHGLFEALFK